MTIDCTPMRSRTDAWRDRLSVICRNVSGAGTCSSWKSCRLPFGSSPTKLWQFGETTCSNGDAMAAGEHFDLLVIGAGLSGIAAGYHLQTKCPSKRFVILEGREAIGGTWDLFRYPGLRSDSDMFTLGYSFKPWTEPNAIADGSRILNYIREA